MVVDSVHIGMQGDSPFLLLMRFTRTKYPSLITLIKAFGNNSFRSFIYNSLNDLNSLND